MISWWFIGVVVGVRMVGSVPRCCYSGLGLVRLVSDDADDVEVLLLSLFLHVSKLVGR